MIITSAAQSSLLRMKKISICVTLVSPREPSFVTFGGTTFKSKLGDKHLEVTPATSAFHLAALVGLKSSLGP